MDKVVFVETDPDVVLADFKADYEALAGKKLQPGQAEMLLIQAATNRLVLQRNAINETANQNFLAFANGAALEYLAELLGVYRLPAAAAECIIRFSLVTGHAALNIPAGIRVQSIDGQLTFITTESKSVDGNTDTVDIKAAATTEGKAGNDYDIGEISVILDPQPYVATASNVDVTGGGSDEENDEELRERMYLAPSRFSVAGPDDAYKFFAKSAHPLIIDVAVKGHTPNPGDVSIYPLLLNGQNPSQEIIDAVNAACNSKKVRPLTDTVYVVAPTKLQYVITIQLTLLTTAVQNEVLAAVNANLAEYTAVRKTRLGLDVVKNQLIKAAMVTGVYNAVVVSPSSDIVTDVNQFTEATAINVTVVGTHDE
jgi:phage-related baseplate assembly protein